MLGRAISGQACRREDYRFAKEFLKDLYASEVIDNHHPWLLRGLYAITGTVSIRPEDVEFLLTLASPDRALKDYATSRVYYTACWHYPTVHWRTEMATVKYVKKEAGGPMGNFKYTYECTCNDKTKKTVTVAAANDNEAKILAQLECDDKCGDA